jgi:hypothetical protein
MHSRTAIRFYEIHTPLTEGVLPDSRNYKTVFLCSFAEPNHFYAAPGKNFDAAPAPTLLYRKAKFLK